MKILGVTRNLSSRFTSFQIEHVPCKQNFRADLMSKLDTLKTTILNKTIIQEIIVSHNIKAHRVYSLGVVPESSWMSPILHYLQLDELLLDEREEKRIWKQPSKYYILSRKLYKMMRVSPMLQFLGEHETSLVLVEVHRGVYNSHINGKALAHKLLRAGYYWNIIMKNSIAFVKKCDQRQRHADIHHALAKLLSRWLRPDLSTSGVWRSWAHPPGIGSIEVIDMGSLLLHHMDRIWSCY